MNRHRIRLVPLLIVALAACSDTRTGDVTNGVTDCVKAHMIKQITGHTVPDACA